jgi:peptide/nickel transport system substrate-binding protein
MVLLLMTLGWGNYGLGKQAPAPQGELRIVDTNRYNFITIVFNVFEHLMELDKDGKLVPRLATGWRWLNDRTLEVTLRRGVTFHNRELFDAEIVKRNWDENIRLQQPYLAGQFLNFKPGTRLEIIDPYTVRFVFPAPDGTALLKLSSMHIGNRQFYAEHGWGEKHWCILDSAGPWGTGPYKIVEGFSTLDKRSDRIVLEANTDYWDSTRFPQLQRIVFDNTLSQTEALELVKTGEGRVDLVSELRPVETLRVAQSPFAKVVKNRAALRTVFGQFNMRKANSPWSDVRLRRAVNLAINRAELIRDVKGNGVIIPALVPLRAFGYDPDLTPYAFDPDRTRTLLREAGYANGLSLTLIDPQELQIQAISISMMLEQTGFTVDLQLLDAATYNRLTNVSTLEGSPERQSWDIALWSFLDYLNFPVFLLYHYFALDGPYDWVSEQPALRQLYQQALDAVDAKQQEGLIRQIERHTHAQAYFLFLYNPIQLYAVNQAVAFVPHVTTLLTLAETSVTETHWSVRKAAVPKISSGAPPLQAEPDNTAQVAVGRTVYAKHCAACHGANLEGQPNWRKRLPSGNFPAPPHDETGHTWHHPDPYLFETTKYGWQRFAPPGYTSTMLGFKDVLTDAEIWAVLGFIKSRWSASIRAQQERLNVGDR